MKTKFPGLKRILLCSITLLSTSIGFCQKRAFMIGKQIAVFYPENYKEKKHSPSFALIKELQKTDELNKLWRIKVDFESTKKHSIATINVEAGTSFYGTGEVTGSLLRNGTVRTLWNTDNYAYEKFSGLQLYQSHPWVMGVREDGTAFGVMADHTYKQKIILDNNITFQSEGPAFRVIVIDKESPEEVLKSLADLTGKMQMPPLWALGYQQCRWSYYPDTRVKEVADTFRIKKIPCDVIWMDIHYMDDYRIFTFSEDNFPDPKGLNNYLHKKDFKSVWMIDPGVKFDRNYSVYQSGSAKDVWVKDAEGKDFHGDVWPGACVFPDFTQSQTREWWADLYKDYMNTGIDGVWNDMNEPAVFNGVDLTMPVDNTHKGDGVIPEGKHSRYHNVYGMLMVKSSREGILKANPDKRPFILTRSNFLGGQRYAATWTGDNEAKWEHLKMSVPMVLNLGISGQPFSGPDIGGFGGNATADLYGHWIATGVFYPFSRSHTAEGTKNQEPWTFGKKIESASRTAIERRYRLLPYLYTLFYESSQTGLPIMRPLFMADVKDLSLRNEDEAFLWGKDLMIIPKWAHSPSIPKGNWRTISIVGENSKKDKYQPELKIREGAIIPLGEIIQSTNQYSLKTITLKVSLDEEGKASGKIYADAGDGFGYQKGEFSIIHFNAEKSGDKVMISSSLEGDYKIKNKVVHVEIISDTKIYKESGTLKKTISVSLK